MPKAPPYATACEWLPSEAGTVIVRGPCVVSGREHSTPPVRVDKLNEFCSGTVHIQDAFPDLDRSEREFLITGISPECWESVVTADEEE